MAAGQLDSSDEHVLVQIASYNTNLQGNLGLPQDLVDWLSPTLRVSSFLSREKQATEIVAVGFQELLPLHFGLAGLSKSVIDSRDALIRSQIEEHAAKKDRYTLVAKVVNVGVALLVYARDDGIARRIRDVQTQWTGCGPCYMGNKGAVGVRFRVAADDDDVGETYTFVNAHLTAHTRNLAQRIADFHHIVGTLIFPPLTLPGGTSTAVSTIYSTSHLFFLGDLNFRLALHPDDPLAQPAAFTEASLTDADREKLKELDQLYTERKKGSAFVGLREGEFWRFKCTFKYRMTEIDTYNFARVPAWTDRILYTTYTDNPDNLDESTVKPVLYTSIPSYTTSDHKPVVALLLVPSRVRSNMHPPSLSSQEIEAIPQPPPALQLPAFYNPSPDRHYLAKRYFGRVLDRLIGYIWTALWYIGLGNAALGIGNSLLGFLAWTWWSRSNASQGGDGLGDIEQ